MTRVGGEPDVGLSTTKRSSRRLALHENNNIMASRVVYHVVGIYLLTRSMVIVVR